MNLSLFYLSFIIIIQEKKEQQQSQVVPSEEISKKDNREELDFQFDEELQNKPTNVPLFVPQIRRRTTSLTFDLYEEQYVLYRIFFINILFLFLVKMKIQILNQMMMISIKFLL